MVMAALAWNLKAWFGLLMPEKASGERVVKMEFRTFLNTIVHLPAQIIRAGRKIVYRILSYNAWLRNLFATWEYLRVLQV